MFREMWLDLFGIKNPYLQDGNDSETGIYKESCDDEQRSACRKMFGKGFMERCGECPFFGNPSGAREDRPDERTSDESYSNG